jgi:two-component system, cell cycle response regulator DivK
MAKILYIEDNPDNMQLVQRVITALGHQFLWAADGLSGIRAVENDQPDLILLDINLPDIDGYEVARRLRANKGDLLYVPIVAITANALKGDAERALGAGCDVYMSKPVNIRELRAHVMGFLPDTQVSAAPHPGQTA